MNNSKSSCAVASVAADQRQLYGAAHVAAEVVATYTTVPAQPSPQPVVVDAGVSVSFSAYCLPILFAVVIHNI